MQKDLDFSEALKWAKKKIYIFRPSWPKGLRITVAKALSGEKSFFRYNVNSTKLDKYIPTADDLLAEDWIVLS
jgi:hypothetical protein